MSTVAGKAKGKPKAPNIAVGVNGPLANSQVEYLAYSNIEGETEGMKVCKFCGVENSDSVSVCPSCGGNEFKNKCGNCGAVFENGNFCPQCGIKAGTKAKKCPNCGVEYFSAACPDCGYINNAGKIIVVSSGATAQPVRQRKTWLWVLGWIFIFPVPLSVFLISNQELKELNKWVKIGIIAAAWILYIIIIIFGRGSSGG